MSHRNGFTLIEVVVSLSILGIALLMAMGLLWQTGRARQGVETEAELLARAEAAVESVRAGVHPLVSGPVDAALAWPVPVEGDRFALLLEVETTDVPGVCRLQIEGRSIDARGRWHTITLETMVFKPGSACS